MRLIYFLAIISFIGCKNDDDSKSSNVNYKDLIVGDWKYYGVEHPYGEMFAYDEPCGFYELERYRADGTVTFYDINNNCQPINSTSETTVYSIKGDEISFNSENDEDYMTAKILELNENEMVLKYSTETFYYKR